MPTKIKSVDFTGHFFYVGIDTHKNNWRVSIRTQDTHLKTFCMDPVPEQLWKHMNTHYPNGKYISVYEAGFCGYWIDRKLRELGFENIIVNPADVPSTNKERDRKSDPIDSAKLSRELANRSLKGIYVPNIHEEALRNLHRLYKQNTRRITQIKNRMKGFLHFVGIRPPNKFDDNCWSNNFLSYLGNLSFHDPVNKTVTDTHLADLRYARTTRLSLLREIRVVSKKLPTINLLMTIPGIGMLTAFSVYSELIDIHRFRSFDHLASYVGLVPSTQSSDTTTTTRGISNRHTRHLRSALIESAWVALRNDEALLSGYNQLISRMKKSEAIIRIAKKLLNRIRYVWKTESPYVRGVVEVSMMKAL